MDTFKLHALFAPPDDVLLTSFYGNLVAALGKMSAGGMIGDGHRLDVGSDAMSLMCLQAIVAEAGCDLILMGAAASYDMDCAFMAMSDGTIWKFYAEVEGDGLTAIIEKAVESDVIEHCPSAGEYSEAIKMAAGIAMSKVEEISPTDTINGTVGTDVHAAICHRLKGSGKLIVRAEGIVKTAYEFTINAPPRVELEEAVSLVSLRKMTLDEIKEEDKSYKDMLGVNSPFHVKVGQA